MDATELAFAGIAQQARLIAAGEISSRELVELYLKRIERLDGQVRAFRVLFGERALLEADQADARRGAGNERPLLGVPIAVKDDLDVAGEVTALGSNAYGDPKPADAEVVRLMREAGAIVIGKTNVPELCIWPFTETVTWGATRNPWDLQRAPGGSSGGSGAAVAAGLVGAALGSDGAGSIRIPSAWCGLFGLKPQRDRVSMAPNAQTWHRLSVNGILTRTVADTALFLDLASGRDGADVGAPAILSSGVDAGGRPMPPQAPYAQVAAQRPSRLKVAYSTKIPPGIITSLDADAARALSEIVELLRSLGHDVREVDPDYGFDVIPAVLARMLRGIRDQSALMPHPERLERRTKALARIGGTLPAAALDWSYEREARIRDRLGRIFAEHDVLLTPATAKPPPRIGQLEGRGGVWTLNAVAGMVPYNAPWNLTGQPACSVPVGLGGDGLPRAVQIVGRVDDEATLLSLAAEIEAERPWAGNRPPLFS